MLAALTSSGNFQLTVKNEAIEYPRSIIRRPFSLAHCLKPTTFPSLSLWFIGQFNSTSNMTTFFHKIASQGNSMQTGTVDSGANTKRGAVDTEIVQQSNQSITSSSSITDATSVPCRDSSLQRLLSEAVDDAQSSVLRIEPCRCAILRCLFYHWQL